jgi:hypothetical protein
MYIRTQKIDRKTGTQNSVSTQNGELSRTLGHRGSAMLTTGIIDH